MINPFIFKAGFFRLSYYSLVYVVGFLVSLFVLLRNKKKIKLKEGEIYDLIALSLAGIIVGARAFHVLFWDFDYFSSNLIKIFYIWEGGLSFHGGFAGVVLAGVIFCKLKKVSLLKIADLVIVPAALFLAIGRVANFINQEIVGKVTDVSWCVNFKSFEGCRHPVQLYAAGGRFLLFLFLMFLSDLKKYKYSGG